MALLSMSGGILGGLSAWPARDERRRDGAPARGVLAVDVGTSGVRAAVVDPAGEVVTSFYRPALPTSPMLNFVEFDPAEQAAAALAVAHEALAALRARRWRRWGSPTSGRRRSCGTGARGAPVGPGVGWQDLRTVGMCLALQAQGLHLAPNASATKLAFLLDLADPDRSRSGGRRAGLRDGRHLAGLDAVRRRRCT